MRTPPAFLFLIFPIHNFTPKSTSQTSDFKEAKLLLVELL